MPERLEQGVRALLRTGLVLLAVLALAAAAERSEVFRALDRVITRHRPLLFGAAAVLAAAGFTVFMGTVIYALVTQGAAPSTGRPFGDRVFLREVKEAYLDEAWRTDRFWRLTMLTILGALTMGLGIFSVVFVLGPAVARALVAGWVFYTTWRLILAWAHA